MQVRNIVADKEDSQDFIHEYTDLGIKGMIYTIRDQQVMLDSDLAELYSYELSQFNRQVKRNIERFPEDFMFQLTDIEYKEILKCQNGISNSRGGRRFLPYVFTEQGIYMLPTVLKGKIAEKQSILIIRTFQKMRHYLMENKQLLNSYDILKMANRLYDSEQSISKIESTMATKDDIQNIMDNFIITDKVKEFAFLKGEQFEADEVFIKIYSEAKYTIYIIDNYISIKTLSHLKHKKDGVDVVIFTTNAGGRDKLRKVELDDFNTQYPALLLKNNPMSHDRYIVLDYNTENEKIYHSGASIKDVGKRISSINEIFDKQLYHIMIDQLLLQNEICI